MQRVVISGWPHLVNATEEEARTQRRVLASLGRFVAQSPATRKIATEAGGERGPIAPATIYSHLDALERLHLLDDSEAWQPHMRSRSRLRTTATRYFVDPSIGTAALEAGSTDSIKRLTR